MTQWKGVQNTVSSDPYNNSHPEKGLTKYIFLSLWKHVSTVKIEILPLKFYSFTGKL